MYISHHIVSIFAGFLSFPLLDWDLFRDQTVCGHHHIIICEPEGRTENTEFSLTVRASAILWHGMEDEALKPLSKYKHIKKKILFFFLSSELSWREFIWEHKNQTAN